MTVDLDKLERLAKTATPGPWDSWPWGVADTDEVDTCFFGQRGEPARAAIGECYPELGQGENDAQYIAAVSPDVVLELIERIRELEQAEHHRTIMRDWEGVFRALAKT